MSIRTAAAQDACKLCSSPIRRGLPRTTTAWNLKNVSSLSTLLNTRATTSCAYSYVRDARSLYADLLLDFVIVKSSCSEQVYPLLQPTTLSMTYSFSMCIYGQVVLRATILESIRANIVWRDVLNALLGILANFMFSDAVWHYYQRTTPSAQERGEWLSYDTEEL